MRAILTATVCLLCTGAARSQTPPDTFYAGLQSETAVPFYVSDQAESAKVAIRLPEALSGRMITSIRAYYQQPGTGVPPETWAADAGFTWGLSVGTVEQPGATTGEFVSTNLNYYPDLQFGGWLNTPVEWPVLEGATYWLVGYWPRKADFVRLTSNQIDTSVAICVGYRKYSQDVWEPWAGGLRVEVAHILPDEGVPSGILDSGDPSGRGGSQAIRASITGTDLVISLSDPALQYSLQVVNVLGQTIVHCAGAADSPELRVPWSATHPSGVYFCRIQAGGVSRTVPVVNIK